jgi:hypothetical protein
MQFGFLGVVVLVIGGYYFLHLKRVKSAGGWGVLMDKMNRDKYGLVPNESVAMIHYTAETYFGPLVPGSDRDIPTGVAAVFDPNTYRGFVLNIVFTSLNRLVFAKEPREQTSHRQMSLGDFGYRPLLSFRPDQARPTLLSAEQAFAGHPQLSHSHQGPQRHNSRQLVERLQLAQLVMPNNGQRYTFWCEAAGLAHIHAWCTGQA